LHSIGNGSARGSVGGVRDKLCGVVEGNRLRLRDDGDRRLSKKEEKGKPPEDENRKDAKPPDERSASLHTRWHGISLDAYICMPSRRAARDVNVSYAAMVSVFGARPADRRFFSAVFVGRYNVLKIVTCHFVRVYQTYYSLHNSLLISGSSRAISISVRE